MNERMDECTRVRRECMRKMHGLQYVVIPLWAEISIVSRDISWVKMLFLFLSLSLYICRGKVIIYCFETRRLQDCLRSMINLDKSGCIFGFASLVHPIYYWDRSTCLFNHDSDGIDKLVSYWVFGLQGKQAFTVIDD